MDQMNTATNGTPQAETKAELPVGQQNAALNMPTLAQIEKEYILRVLGMTGGSKEKAAQVLGVSTKTVYNKLAKYAQQG